MKKVKNQKKLFWHLQVDLKGIWNNFFLVLTQSEKLLLAYTAHTLAKINWYISGPDKKKIFFISALKSPTYRDFMT